MTTFKAAKNISSTGLMLLRWVALLTILGCHIAKAEDQRFLEFEKTVHPFLRKNCAKCHDETAVWPVGPLHSHSNPAIAYPHFQARIDFSDISKSRFFTFGSNGHYCKALTEFCPKKDEMAEGIKRSLLNYDQNLKTSEVTPSVAISGQGSSIKLTGKDTGIQFLLSRFGQNDEILLTTSLEVFENSDYVRILSVEAKGKEGVYYLEGLRFFVNGEEVKKQTGYEGLQRYLILTGALTPINLAPYMPIFSAKEGDRLSISVDKITQVPTFPTKLCNDLGLFETIIQEYNDDSWLEEYSSRVGENYNMRPSDETLRKICLQVESDLGLGPLQRSILFSKIKRAQGANASSFSLLELVSNWARQISGEETE